MEFRQIISALILIGLISLIIRLFLKRKIRITKLIRWCELLSDKFHDHQLLQIPEFNDNSQENHLFRRVTLYLNSLESLEDSDNTNLFSGLNPNDIVLTLSSDQTILDTFLGARVSWTYRVLPPTSCGGETRYVTLRIRTRDKRRVLRSYLQHIHAVSDEIDQRKRVLRLFTAVGCGGRWRSVPFTHPATMETVAMDVDIKNKVNLDLETFLKSKQYYHRIGRVWRRSYLLYGPSGTGKSSFAAALAKTLSYDVYDLDLAKVGDEFDLKLLLLRTTPRSVILIEDFDKYVAAAVANAAAAAAGGISAVMNFMDGVVNSCCDERVMVFTMMTKDEIDPAILRPGRIDVHIHFPMCDFNNFKNLANNYLGLKEHKLFPQVEEMFSSGATLSPAEIGELMMGNRNSPSRALKSVITALQTKSSIGGVCGGDENCRVTTPKNGFRSGRNSLDGSVDGGGFRDGAKEIKKLYGLLRKKSILGKSQSFDLGT
ncbi:AAA-ATPase At2g46620-like [Silene latifolia]|uniref:AAA-ATPase At2g46620-like n=1 Tax=Silene latifolia TaxID=37657 RepID=UPI003D77BB22